MKLTYENINDKIKEVLNGNQADLSDVSHLDSWSLALVLSILIEKQREAKKRLILPTNKDLLRYLKEIGFSEILDELNYKKEAKLLDGIEATGQEDLNIKKITHCRLRSHFDGKLSYFLETFREFGLKKIDPERVTSLIGELGNNSFDHNLGNWPTDFMGCLIIVKNYPKEKYVQVIVSDAGVGFLTSLLPAFPELKNDIEALRKGLRGNTGRVGEKRGNGLKVIQDWTIKNFSGKVSIQSGEGLIEVDKNGMHEEKCNKILGTIAQLTLHY